MRCPNCHVKNPDYANFCGFCGFELTPGPPVKRSKSWIWAVALICAGVALFLYYNPWAPSKASRKAPSQDDFAPSHFESKRTHEEQPLADIAPAVRKPHVSIGIVSLRDISGEVTTRIPVPLVSEGWFALPVDISYGGYKWSFSDEPDEDVEIEWGILNEHDQVGLWWIEGRRGMVSPELSPLQKGEPLYWASILSNDPPEKVQIRGFLEQNSFIKIKMHKVTSEPGIFFQQDKVVGWSFGDLSDGGYLWTSIPGRELAYNLRVDDFYRLTFAGSREEAFAMALGKKNATDAERLLDIAKGFRLETKIPQSLIPSHLRTKIILKKAEKLVTGLMSQADYQAVADCFDDQVLIQAQDPMLLANVAYAFMKAYGYENALWLLETVMFQNPSGEYSHEPKLTKLQLKLYQDWISEMIKEGNYNGAARVLDSAVASFPEDPDIHLWGVRLALAQEDWAQAEQLLYARQYPESLKDKIKNLDNEISELKSQEENIVIRFVPHSNHIPVRGILNGSLSQQFIIDTGASMTTVPVATATRLGIKVDKNLPVRTIYTAGGIIEAPEVNLGTIEIDGWVIYNLKALLVDLPQQGGTGLLGLNYLNRFSMHLDSERGQLTLGPK